MRIAHLALMVFASTLGLAQGRPRLALDAQEFDFGRVAPETTVSHRFKITNTGDAPLLLSRPKPSCGCTSTVVGKDSLLPGESTELEVTLNTAGLLGVNRKNVQLLSNDQTQPSQVVSFQAEVLADVTPSVREVFFLDLDHKDRRKATVKLKSETGHPIVVTDADLSDAPWLGVATRTVGKDILVDFDLFARRITPGRLAGTDSVALHLENPRASIVNLRVSWEFRQPVSASPGRVVWSETTGRELSTAVVLRHRANKPFSILSARTTSPLLQVRGVGRGPAVRQTVQVVLAAEARAGTYNERVLLTLDLPGHPELAIRVAAALH